MGHFDNLTSTCREKFTDMSSEFLEFINKKGYEHPSFIQFKKNKNPNFDPKLYADTMIKTKEKQKKLLHALQENDPISDYYIDSLREGCAGAIIRKIIDFQKQTNEEIRNSLKSTIDSYSEVFKKYFPDDTPPDSLEDYNNRGDRYDSNPRL